MANIHLIREPDGYVALKTACGFDCSPDRDTIHLPEFFTPEGGLVTCSTCKRYVGNYMGWAIENVTHKRAAT